MAHALRAKPGAFEQRRGAGRGHVGAVAGNVLMKPPIAADPGLDGAQVRDRHHERAAGPQPGPDPPQRGGRVVEMLERVPEHDGVLAGRLELGVGDADVRDLDPVRARRGAGRGRRVDPVGVEARRRA